MVYVDRRTAIGPVLLVALLAGCAGNSDVPGLVDRMVGVAPMPPAPSVLLDVPSLTEEKCLDERDFAPMSDPEPGNNRLRALVSRHVDCRQGESAPVVLGVGNPGAGRASVAAGPNGRQGAEPTAGSIGTARFISRVSVYGPSNALRKRVSVTVRAVDVTPDAVWSEDDGVPMVQVRPLFTCGSSAELFGESPDCHVASGGPIVVPLDGREASGEYVIEFDWTQRPGQNRDVVTFDLAFNTFAYWVREASSPAGSGATEGASFDVSSADADVFDAGLDAAGIRIRCDRGVARAGTKGCIFPQAAAVFVVPSGSDTGAEAVAHMEDALEHGAPGRFRMRADFRALADESVMAQGGALHRTQIAAMRNANRYASCSTVSTSIISRHPQHSASCPNERADPCDCDEYPFASTYEGAFAGRTTTSARFVSRTDNRAVGSALADFYARQRVIDMSYETEQRGTLKNPYPSFVFDETGDAFWVHIAPR